MAVVEVAEKLFDLKTFVFGDVVAELEDEIAHLTAVAAEPFSMVCGLSRFKLRDHVVQ